jgi:hypothetical protein
VERDQKFVDKVEWQSKEGLAVLLSILASRSYCDFGASEA